MKKNCKECPWKVKNNHNDNLIKTIIRWVKNGSRKNTKHVCHMVNPNIWGEVNDKNVCAGSIKSISSLQDGKSCT